MALALAEQHENAELYREASRFVLDQRKRKRPQLYHPALLSPCLSCTEIQQRGMKMR